MINQKLNLLLKFDDLNKADIEKFGNIIKELDDWDLFRINPITFAKKYGFNLDSLTNIFIYAVKIGLLDFSWNLICPMCGSIEYSHDNLNNLSNKDFTQCIPCDIKYPTDLDSQVEVSFKLSSTIRELKTNPYEDLESYFKYFFSQNHKFSEKTVNVLKELFLGLYVIEPDDVTKVTIEAKPNRSYRLLSLQRHSELTINANNKVLDLPQIIEVDLLNNGFHPEEISICAGKATFYVHNRTKSKLVIDCGEIDFDKLEESIVECPFEKTPFMTGKMLLNNQKFRELFRIQALAPDLKLNVKSLTIMFTDLKGSTEMYEKIGDINAYDLVQKHFEILIDSVKKYSGAVVKTMGDAIMATFSTPVDSILASIDMMTNIKNNDKWISQGHEIGLKIGLNEGNALVVNSDDRLDYFGQSVNISARVQGLAEAGEIWLTESVYNDYKVKELLSEFKIDKQYATLKGVGEPVIVYKCYN